MEQCSKYYVIKGLNGEEKLIHEDVRLVFSTKDGTFYEITLSSGKRRETRFLWYRHNQFN